MSTQDAIDYYQITDDNSMLTNKYSGNPNLVAGIDWQNITLDKLGLNADAVKDQLKGMEYDLLDPVTNEPYPDAFYTNFIYKAVAETEKDLDIAIRPRQVNDRLDYFKTDFSNYMFVHTMYKPVLHVDEILLYFNTVPVQKYPDDWIKVTNRLGELNLQPSVLQAGSSTGMLFTPYAMNGGFPVGMPNPVNDQFSPQMIGVSYVAGMLPINPGDEGLNYDWNIQPDLQAYIAKQAAIEVLERYGRIAIGAGIASKSVSLDDAHISIDSTQSAENTATTADIKLMQADMKTLKAHLVNYYGGNNIGFIN